MFKIIKEKDLRKNESYDIEETFELVDIYDVTLELVSLAREYHTYLGIIEDKALQDFFDEIHKVQESISKMKKMLARRKS